MIGTTDNNIDCDYRLFILPEDLVELNNSGVVVGDYVQMQMDGIVERGLTLKFDEDFRGFVDMKPKGRGVEDLDSLEIIVGFRGLSRLGEMLEHYEARSGLSSGRKVHFHYVPEDNLRVKLGYSFLCKVRDELINSKG